MSVVRADIVAITGIIENLKSARESQSKHREAALEQRDNIASCNLNLKDLKTLKNRIVTSANDLVTCTKSNIAIRTALSTIISVSKDADDEAAGIINDCVSTEVEVNKNSAKAGNTEDITSLSNKFTSTIKLNNGDYIGLTSKEASLYDTIKAKGGSLKDLWTALGYSSYADFAKDFGVTEEEANKINETAKTTQTPSRGGATGRDTVNTAHWSRTGQYNGGQYEYHFSTEFNDGLQKSVDKLLGQCNASCALTEDDKAHLSSVLPYYLKGIGASESGWSNGSQGYMGLTNQKGVYYASFTFDDTFGPYDLSKASTFTKNEGAEVAAAEFIHWVDYYRGKGNSLDKAIWESWKSYTGGSESCAAYQMNMANEFYTQDGNGGSLFYGECTNPINNPGNYGVSSYNYANPEVCNC